MSYLFLGGQLLVMDVGRVGAFAHQRVGAEEVGQPLHVADLTHTYPTPPSGLRSDNRCRSSHVIESKTGGRESQLTSAASTTLCGL